MRNKKDIVFDKEAREKLIKGVDTMAKAVTSTLGPLGRNVAIKEPNRPPIVLHDGVGVARQVILKDSLEDIGAEILKSAAIRTNEVAGDGTTTATALAHAIIIESMQAIASGVNPMVIKSQIEKAHKKVVKELTKLSKSIKTDKEAEQIATISSSSSEIGKIVADAIKKVGKDGVVTVEESQSSQTYVDYKEGVEIDRGYLSPNFINQNDTKEAIIDNPYILITDKKINHDYEIVPFLQKVKEAGVNDLVIIAGECVEEGLSTLVINKLKGAFNLVVIQAPSYGVRRTEELEDLAVLMGGVSILHESGRLLESVEVEELGRAEKVKVNDSRTIIINGDGNKDLLKSRMAELKSQIKTGSDYEKDSLRERLAKLSGGVAVIYAGGPTEVEVKEKKERIIDAVNSTKAAIEEGVVAGGQLALTTIARMPFWDDESDFGASVLKKALTVPFKILMENSGLDYAQVWGELSKVEYPYGIDVMDGKIKDLIESGIIDPLKVERVALENAVSVATMLMTTDVLITDVEED